MECPRIKVLPLMSDRSHVVLGIAGKHENIKVFGFGHVRALKGHVNILGHLLTPLCAGEKFFAPASDCALVFETSSNNDGEEITSTADILGDDIATDEAIFEDIQDILVRFDIVLLLSATSESLTFPGYPDLFNVRQCRGEVEQELNAGAYIVKTERFFRHFPAYLSAYTQIADHIWKAGSSESSRRPVILTVGGKSSGKSTCNRYLINKMLQRFSQIDYLECDVGQPEFTPPGFVSVTSLTTPLLGPPFTHMSSPKFSVYHGNVNVAGQPDRYIESIMKAFEWVDVGKSPIIVNTMGWNKGFGCIILMDIIRIVCPTHVLQMSSQNESKNSPLLTNDFVRECEGGCVGSGSIVPNFKHLVLDVDIKLPEINSYNPADLRNLRILAYLGEMTKSFCDRNNILSMKKSVKIQERLTMAKLCSAKAYRVKMSDVLLCVSHETGVIWSGAPALFNGTLVGLCAVSKSYFEESNSLGYIGVAPVCECFGIALVRAVDMDQGYLYIVSHLHGDILKCVNCLSLGVLRIPECLQEDCRTPELSEVHTPIPYVSDDFPFEVSGSSKFRVYRSFAK